MVINPRITSYNVCYTKLLRADKFETLRALPFFENFSDAELWEVASYNFV